MKIQDLKRAASAQATAYDKMLEIGEGVGGLGIYHPELFQDMIAWDDLSENSHADTVLELIEEIERIEDATYELGMGDDL